MLSRKNGAETAPIIKKVGSPGGIMLPAVQSV
ncbi:hypothetical protein KP1_2590 [Klebsiella pneumoniae subsp. pneumoniae NTUH-K2044]|nr:hypothetical protein KP1_2590 [Klebsiella pneumoniae subsp. pneumoniae NTUH-K2044]